MGGRVDAMSAGSESLRALRLITIAGWIAAVRGPLHWLLARVLYQSYGGSHGLARVVNGLFSIVGIGCAVVVILALTRLGDWRRANVWVRAAWGAFIAQAAIASFSLFAWLGLHDVLPAGAFETVWAVSTVIHTAAPALLILVLHRARQPQGFAPWLWPLFAWMALVDLGLPLAGLVWHWDPLSGTAGEIVQVVLSSGSDVAILLLLHDVHARLARAPLDGAQAVPAAAPGA